MPPLASLLRLNAASCLVFGALFVAVPDGTAGFLGSPPDWLVFVIGAVLLLNGVHLILASRRTTPIPVEILYFVAGDMAWVMVTLALIATGTFVITAQGVMAAVVIAGFVGAIGTLQYLAVRQ